MEERTQTNQITALDNRCISQLRVICPHPGQVLYEAADCLPYGCDNSKQYAQPAAVVLPQTHDEVVKIVQLCRTYHLPITPRGRGTNTTGAALPIHGGVVVCMEHMNRILKIDTVNRTLHAQTGVSNRAIQDYCAIEQLFWPPDPGSADFCTLGGNLACNAAGPRAVKYGTTRENTLKIKAVTGAGNTLCSGAITSKSVVGLDLTRLLIGSEGTLAIITEAVLKLSKLPPSKSCLRLDYRSVEAALQAVCRIMELYETPSALELLDDKCLQLLKTHTNLEIGNDVQAILIVEADGSKAAVSHAIDAIHQVAIAEGLYKIWHADNDQQSEALWAARKQLSPVLRNYKPCKINEDIVVPISELPELVRGLDDISQKNNVSIVNFGHVGNGNLHVNILYQPEQEQNAQQALTELFELTLKLNGSLSGEHGIGLSKRELIKKELDPYAIELMHQLTKVMDPDDILNSGKGLPISS
ncbi:MAG: FAD-binding protein [Chromatiales bacterium]|nr:FAD-binding protein [Chromatiales bacterium]